MVSLPPLATEADVKEALGRDLTPDEQGRLDAVLSKASELFRAESGQQFTAGTSLSRLKVNGRRVWLPQSPATGVLSVTTEAGEEVEPGRLHKQWLSVPLASHEFVYVEYEHGGVVPDLVRLTVADVAAVVLSIDPAAARGVTQVSDTGGRYSRSETYAAWAQGGRARLAPDDVAVARRFRRRVPTVWVMRP